MKPFLIVSFAALGLVSCSQLFTPYSPAKIVQEPVGGEPTREGGLTYRYRIGGLQQMSIFLNPQRGSFLTRDPRDSFTQVELSKLRIKAKSLGGRLNVNGLEIGANQSLEIDLKKRYNADGRGEVVDFGRYISNIRFASYNVVRGRPNHCDFLLTIEDPEGITRTTGLKVHGGFTDSL